MRIAAFAVGIFAALAMVVVGCTQVTDGGAGAVPAEAAQYRASVAAASSAAVASSRAREAERQAALTGEAIRRSCEELSSSSADAVGAVNTFVAALNEDPAAAAPVMGPAIDALNNSADLVNASLSDELPTDLRDPLTSWIDAARGVANAIAGNYPIVEINAAIARLNDTKTVALDRCDEAYR